MSFPNNLNQFRYLLLCLLISCISISFLYAQDTKRIPSEGNQGRKWGKLDPLSLQKSTTWTPSFSYSISDTLNPGQPNTYLQGIVWTGSEFWIGVWGGSYQGSIYRVDSLGRSLGAFSVIGITGITGMTVVEDTVFAVNESDKIYKINKHTRRRLSTLTIDGDARPTFLTYSDDLNNGEGGFFAGNFELASPLYALSMSGESLYTVSADVHKQRVMAGAAYDTLSAGGPYLWVFNQAEPGNPSEAVISQLDANTGQFTGVFYDVTSDYGDSFSAAGGLFVSSNLRGEKLIIGGILQSSPSDLLIGYDLNFQVPTVDANLNYVRIEEGLTQVPIQHRPDLNFSGTLTNKGLATLTEVEVELRVKRADDATLLYSGKDTLNELEYFEEGAFQIGPWTGSEKGTFIIETELSTGQQPDESLLNNVNELTLVVGDSIMALDDAQVAGSLSLGFGAETKSYFGQVFPAKEELFDYLTSITFTLTRPQKGDLIQASVFDMDPETGRPTTIPVASTISYQITQQDQDSGVVLTLPLADGPYPIFPGEFFVAVKEGERPLTLAYSNNIYRPGERFLRTDIVITGTPFDGDWVEIEEVFAVPVKPALMIRPNFGNCVPTYMEGEITVTGDRGNGDGTATVSVTGAGEAYTYIWDDPAAQTTAQATGLSKDQVYTVIITDTTGCTLTLKSDPIPNLVSVDDLPGVGIVSLKVHPNPAYEDLVVEFELDRPDQIQLRLTDLKGQTIFEDGKKQAFYYQRRIYIRDYPSGIYILEVQTSRGKFSQRLMFR